MYLLWSDSSKDTKQKMSSQMKEDSLHLLLTAACSLNSALINCHIKIYLLNYFWHLNNIYHKGR